jgi:D-tyrosyl-tRNA(Tyr) deacylase
MKAVVQRVSSASVVVEGENLGEIASGLLVLLGVAKGDEERDAEFLAEKIVGLRIFGDAEGKMNLTVVDAGGAILAVSQFTLLGDCRKGRRPSFVDAAPPEVAERLYRHYVARSRALGVRTETGRFQAHMEVRLVNDGPVTILLDSRS